LIELVATLWFQADLFTCQPASMRLRSFFNVNDLALPLLLQDLI